MLNDNQVYVFHTEIVIPEDRVKDHSTGLVQKGLLADIISEKVCLPNTRFTFYYEVKEMWGEGLCLWVKVFKKK